MNRSSKSTGLSRGPCKWLILATIVPFLLNLVLMVSCSGVGWRDDVPEKIAFNQDVRPIFSNTCFACHGPDENKREADLRLDIRESALTGGESGQPAIVPGDITSSELVRRITHRESDKRMPPRESGHRLTSRQIKILKRWIEQGAEYQPHWSHIKPSRPELPIAKDEGWVKNPVDRFILANLEGLGLNPSPQGDRVTLIRRLSFDLTGLPAKPEQVEAFLNDHGDQGYENLVDRLLASPHYGERMAMHWLDLVRYADTNGYHTDEYRSIYPYRDYVIKAFNDNKGFDQFTIEQLAGDLLANATVDQKVASGYNRLNQITCEGGVQEKEYLAKYFADRVRTTSSVWLGMTMGCAECHDHKFDPITQKDFYSFGAFNADLDEKGKYEHGSQWEPALLLPNEEQAGEMKQIANSLSQLRKALEMSTDKRKLERLREQTTALNERKEQLQKNTPRTLVSVSVEPRVIRILGRGDWMDESGAMVTPAVPDFLGKLDVEKRGANRLDLARWMVSRENPLTARLFVNRLWALFFGTGIAEPLDDLGAQGEAPRHPELLDWLAVEFMESGWDVKHTVKLLVMSATYRQSSDANEEMREIDPDNRLLARQSRFRLPAEMVRDNVLAISGLLSGNIGGPSVWPYQPEGYWDNALLAPHLLKVLPLDPRSVVYTADKGENQYRRGLYTFWRRSCLHPSLLAFDAPTREECTVKRTVSNTPLQALVLLNDPTYIEGARVFGERILKEGGSSTSDRMGWAFRRALSRKPTAGELPILVGLYEKHLDEFTRDSESVQQLISTGQWPIPNDLDAAELAAWTSVARVILNLHETITRF